jgi:chromosome partitioning protein
MARKNTATDKTAAEPHGPVVAVSNLKGGSGKTVLAVHLAHILGATLLDLDPQGDAHDWATRSGLVSSHHVHGAQEVFDLLETITGPIVLDTPPGEGENLRTALAVADVIVIPVKPGSSDLRALGRMENLITEARSINSELKVGVVLNEAKAISSLTRAVEEALGHLDGVTYLGHLGDRVAFPEAMAGGGVVTGSAAADEITVIAGRLAALIKE